MWFFPATARAGIRRRWPWSAICWRWRTARGGSRFRRPRRGWAREFEVPHYIRFLVDDRPGIVADITVALAKEQINIRAIVQKPGYPQHALPFVVTVEPCKASAMKRALAHPHMDCLLKSAGSADAGVAGNRDIGR